MVCNKRTVESLIKAGAFDSLGHTRARADQRLRAGRRRRARHQARRGDRASSTCSARSASEDAGAVDDVFAVPRCPTGEWDKKVLLQFEREMLGLYVSDHPLFGVEHVLAGAADVTDRRAAGRGAPTSRRSSRWPASCPSVNRRVTKAGRAVGAGHARGPRGLDRGDVLPADLRAGRAAPSPRTPIVAVKGRTDAREDTVKLIAVRPDRPRPDRGAARAGAAAHRGRPGARRRWSTGSRRCWPPTRARPRCTCSWQRRATSTRCVWRRVPGHAVGRADGRPQGAARPRRDLGLSASMVYRHESAYGDAMLWVPDVVA